MNGRRVVSGLAGAVLATAVLAGIALAGVTVSMRDSYPGGVEQGDWPAPRDVPPGATVVAVVLGTDGSVISDALLPYEAFARASGFFVYTVAAHRRPVPLSGGLRVVPEHTFGTAPEPDVVVVPAVVSREAELEAWLRGTAMSGAYILGVCAGAEVLADAGLLAGRRATSFWQRLGGLRASFPDTTWLSGERFVEDGRVVTTAGVTSGLAGSLRLVELLAGPAEAIRIGQELSYQDWSPGADTRIPRQGLAIADLPYALNAAFPWLRPVVGIGLTDGVGEIDVAAAFETYAGTSFAARAVPIAIRPAVTTRHGLLLIAGQAAADRSIVPGTAAMGPSIVSTPAALDRLIAPGTVPVDRLIVPGTDQPGTGLAAWAATRGLDVSVPHAGRRPGEFAFDPLLRDLAEHADNATARTTAKFTEYPAGHLTLTGAAWPWRSTFLGLAALVFAIGTGLLPRLISARRSLRRGKS